MYNYACKPCILGDSQVYVNRGLLPFGKLSFLWFWSYVLSYVWTQTKSNQLIFKWGTNRVMTPGRESPSQFTSLQIRLLGEFLLLSTTYTTINFCALRKSFAFKFSTPYQESNVTKLSLWICFPLQQFVFPSVNTGNSPTPGIPPFSHWKLLYVDLL